MLFLFRDWQYDTYNYRDYQIKIPKFHVCTLDSIMPMAHVGILSRSIGKKKGGIKESLEWKLTWLISRVNLNGSGSLLRI